MISFVLELFLIYVTVGRALAWIGEGSTATRLGAVQATSRRVSVKVVDMPFLEGWGYASLHLLP